MADDHVIGMSKKTNRVDFFEERFAGIIERSPRLVWERAMPCPCTSLNSQTQQTDPNCATCSGDGVLRVGGPLGYTPNETVIGPLDLQQKAVQARHNGVVISGFFQSATHQQTSADTFGKWFWGEKKVTVRQENRLGYYDRLFNLDSEIPYAQMVDVPDAGPLRLRYVALAVTHMIDSAGSRYEQDTHFTIDANGDIVFLFGVGPAAGAQISVRYLTFPAWVVMEYPHVIRASTRKRKKKQQTPQDLVIQATVRLEYELERS
jgi:hypothetical protein